MKSNVMYSSLPDKDDKVSFHTHTRPAGIVSVSSARVSFSISSLKWGTWPEMKICNNGESRLLRKVGGSYLFKHHQLLFVQMTRKLQLF